MTFLSGFPAILHISALYYGSKNTAVLRYSDCVFATRFWIRGTKFGSLVVTCSAPHNVVSIAEGIEFEFIGVRQDEGKILK